MHSKRPDSGRHDARPPRVGRSRPEDRRPVRRLSAPDDMPAVLTQADLHRHWRALMGELGFTRARLYVQIFTGVGRCTPVLLDVADLPDLPDPSTSDRLLELCAQALDDVGDPDARVALLYARPGSARRRSSDLAWARQLATSAKRSGVPIFPVHVATDETLMALAPDDLGRPA